MEYKSTPPDISLQPFIHCYWELKGTENDGRWERIFPDGCAGMVMNLGTACKTDNGAVELDTGKTYAVGAMTSFKDTYVDDNTHLLGVCLKPGAFTNFYSYVAQNEIANHTVAFDPAIAFQVDSVIKDSASYLNRFFSDRIKSKRQALQSVINDVHISKGQLTVHELSKRNFTTVRQLERSFKTHVGISPKEYSNIIRFQNALRIIQNNKGERSLLDIAFDCGFHDHAHLTRAIKRNTGLLPSQL